MEHHRFTPLRPILLVSLALLMLLAGQAIRSAPAAEAAAPNLQFPSSSCSGGTANVTFGWSAVPEATQLWLDLTIFDNNFAPGSFISAGPLSPSQTSIVWNGILANTPHFWRVNALTPSGWQPSITGTFVPCGGPALLYGPLSCTDTQTATVNFRWAPSSPRAQVQYLDLSYDGSFAPGTFSGIGPIDASQGELLVPGLRADVWTFFRVNSLQPNGSWLSTPVAGFAAPCAPAPQGPLNIFVDTNLYYTNDRIVVSHLGINAPVNVRGVGPDGIMGDPEGKDDVVRYDFPAHPWLGGYPGSGGTAVLAGHVDYHPNFQAVFWYIRQAQAGDRIDYYRADGAVISYAVDWTGEVGGESDVAAYMPAGGGDAMLLITCDGTFNPVTRHYDSRFMVHAVRIN